MPVVYPAQWSRGAILQQALQKAGNKKIVQLARDRLNRLLEELYTQYEWPFLYTDYQFMMPSGNTGGPPLWPTFQLPTQFPLTLQTIVGGVSQSLVYTVNFMKTMDEVTSLRISTKNGLTVDLPIVETNPVQFRRRAIPHDLQGDRPLIWYVDYSTLFGVTWPVPTAACFCDLRFKFLPTDQPIGSGGPLFNATDPVTTAYDAAIPLFPYGGFLAMEMERWALDYDHDPRARDLQAEIWGEGGVLERIRDIAMPRQSQDDTLPLDPQVFGPGFRDEASRYFRDWDWWGPSN